MSFTSRIRGSVQGALSALRTEQVVLPLTHDADTILNEVLAKGSRHVVPSYYDVEDVPISNKERPGMVDVTDTQAIRRAIHTISNYYNTLGVYRDDFDKNLNDKLSRNTYYVLCEKAIQDYMGSAKFKVVDKDGELVEEAMDFLEHPNPQEDFGAMLKMVIRDTVRYDAGVIVKSFNAGGYLTEMKAYLGTEFWKEQDRVSMIVNMPFSSVVNFDRSSSTYATHWQPAYTGWWSHGYVERYWQRSRTGVYIPFQPEEIVYFMLYPRSDGIYGTDFLKYLRYQLQYLIDSTKAAGKTFENGLVPSIVWGHEKISNISQLEQRIREVRASNQGPNRFGSVLHTVQGEKVESFAQTLHNMEWLEGQKFVAQIIWAMWGFSPAEFVGEGDNRATAYVKRNVTKSRLLYPLMDFIEKKMDREVLPYLKGYKKGWKFLFLRDVDLDDDQKIAQTSSVRAGTVAQYIGLGFTASQAMHLAGLQDELKLMDEQALDDQVMQFGMAQLGTGPGDESGGDSEGEMGRYDSENAGTGGYVPVNVSDYGQGGENTEQRFGEAEEKEYKKGERGKDQGQKIVKAKVYINSPSEAPKGRTVKRGGRGGYYYITSEKQPAHPKSPTGQQKKPSTKVKHREGWGVHEKQKPEAGDFEEPVPPDVKGCSRYLIVEGDDISFYLMDFNGRVKAQALDNPPTRSFIDLIRNCFKSNDEDMFDCVRRMAKENGLTVTVG